MSEQPEGVGDEAMTEQPEKKAPLIERLEAVPAYARLVIFDGLFTPTDFPVGIIHPASTTYPVGAMTHEAAAELRRLQAENAELLAALKDMHSGWKYIRETHGDLYGVGWDRSQGKAEAAIAKAEDKT
jgi:hypothetical protein